MLRGKVKNAVNSGETPVELFVGNLHDSVQKPELDELFSLYGTVINIERFKAKPIAFVTFSCTQEAEDVTSNHLKHIQIP